MPTALDALLNFLVPILVVIGLLWILYKPFKKPLDGLGGWIKNILWGKEEEGEALEGSYNLPVIRQNLDFE